jgi:Tfp pilus assembly protein PilN
LSKLDFLKRKPLTALLGLSLDGSRLEGAVVHLQNGSLQLVQSFTATLALDPLTSEPELVGREVLNHLEAAGIRERHCAVAVPLKWVLTAHTTLPDMPEADEDTFLKIEAERGFSCDTATLRVAISRFTTPSGVRHATFVGIPATHLQRLEQVLRAAKLKPVSFSPGVTALQPPVAGADGVLALALGEDQIALQITCSGGVAALRTLDGVMDTGNGAPIVNTGSIVRETRITLGQLSPECRAMVKRIRIFGPPELARTLAEEVRHHFQSMGINVAVIGHDAGEEFGATIPPQTVVSVAFSMAARQLTAHSGLFEFLPPKISPWKQLTTQYSSGKLQTAGAVTGALALLVAAAFGIQQWQLYRLNSRWTKMQGTVHELEGIQQNIRQYRPWFDDSFRGLTILRDLTTAFPQDGTVTAKTMEIRDQNTVSCSGTARDNAALLQTLSQLRSVDGVHNVKLDSIRGKTPLQFTFGFQYGTEAPHEN